MPPTCSSSLITESGFNNNFTLLAVPPGAQDLIDNGISPAPVGKIVPVTTTKVSQVVQAANGQVIQGLSITPLADDESNNPSGSTSSSATSTAATATTTGKKKNAAPTMRGNWAVLTIASGMVVSWLSLI